MRTASAWALGLTAHLAACGASAPHPPYVQQQTSALVAVDSSPPPGRLELIPRRPDGADAWVDGEWVLRHGRWLWLLGRWVQVPPGARYSPWTTVRGPDGTLYYAPSVWVDGQGRATDAPPPLAVAKASGEAVFTPSGDLAHTGRNVDHLPAQPDAGAPAEPEPR